ncbi:hypothetical protein [Lacticaseibacillus parakribbianus]|uniref:hypothetical protein n=1 Tax=Lacticaseibacillus parakribbianus TaxID=2970927 RepID=UPI0021CB8603|nr:hypothetical protein [Lacticaseibacillus parakribbianus]
MFGQIRLELRKQPWLLHLAGLIAMLLLFAGPLGHALGVIPTTYRFFGGVRTPSYVNYTTDSEAKAVQKARAAVEKQYVGAVKIRPANDTKAMLKLMRDLRRPLAQRDYLTANKLTLAAIDKEPLLANSYELKQVINTTDAGSASLNADAMAASLHYYIDHRINSLQIIDEKVSAVTAVQGVMSRYGSHVYKVLVLDNKKQSFVKLNAGTPLTWIFLCYVVLALALVFNFDRRNNTENLMRMSPRRDWAMVLVRAAVTLSIIVAVLALTVVLALAINAGLSGHTLGPLGYPLITTSAATVIVTPVWQYVGTALAQYVLWAVLLSGVAYVVTQFVAEPLLVLLLCSLTFLGLPLKFLEVLPLPVRQLFPGLYTNPPALADRADYFRLIPLHRALTVLIVWTVVAWVLGVVVQHVRYRKRGPWLN